MTLWLRIGVWPRLVIARRQEQADDDRTLVIAAQRDPRAFTPLYERYVRPIYRYCYVRLGTVEAAEDATSEVFLKALASIDTQRGVFAAWLFRIARNVVTDAYRRHRPSTPLHDAIDLPTGDPTPESRVEQHAEVAALHAALLLLPPDQRSVLELQLADWSGAQIAGALGKSTDAIKMLRYRAIDRLRGLLAPYGHAMEEHR